MSIYTVAGPLASHLLNKVFGDERKVILPDVRQFMSLAIKGEGEEVLIAHGTGLALPGFMVICTSTAAESLKKAIKEEEGVVEGGEEAWQVSLFVASLSSNEYEILIGLFHPFFC